MSFQLYPKMRDLIICTGHRRSKLWHCSLEVKEHQEYLSNWILPSPLWCLKHSPKMEEAGSQFLMQLLDAHRDSLAPSLFFPVDAIALSLRKMWQDHLLHRAPIGVELVQQFNRYTLKVTLNSRSDSWERLKASAVNKIIGYIFVGSVGQIDLV